eukprot:scaffold14401_cov58-Cyclotella_meneghiniana.AAC.21
MLIYLLFSHLPIRLITTEPFAGGDSTTEKYNVVLVATGRRPYTEGLGLENLGIQTDRLGRIRVDSHFRTAVPSIHPIGDCIDGPMLAHKAEEEGISAVEIIAGYAGHVDYDAIPGVIYIPGGGSCRQNGGRTQGGWCSIQQGDFPISGQFLSTSKWNCTIAVGSVIGSVGIGITRLTLENKMENHMGMYIN